MRIRLAKIILKLLNAAGDEPLPELALIDAVFAASADKPPDADIRDAITLCQENGWITGTKDQLTGVYWSLTTAGKLRHQKNQA